MITTRIVEIKRIGGLQGVGFNVCLHTCGMKCSAGGRASEITATLSPFPSGGIK
jgi:hypothetical protein